MITCLRNIGLIAHAIDRQDKEPEIQSYYAGEKFLDLIAFMGCAPTIQFSPDDSNKRFTHVRIISSPDKTLAKTGQHTLTPRCPHCRQTSNNWRGTETQASWQCASCGEAAEPRDYHWRRSAGFARLFIEITEIYPKEAIPQSSLLDTLTKTYQTPWDYFYI